MNFLQKIFGKKELEIHKLGDYDEFVSRYSSVPSSIKEKYRLENMAHEEPVMSKYTGEQVSSEVFYECPACKRWDSFHKIEYVYKYTSIRDYSGYKMFQCSECKLKGVIEYNGSFFEPNYITIWRDDDNRT